MRKFIRKTGKESKKKTLSVFDTTIELKDVQIRDSTDIISVRNSYLEEVPRRSVQFITGKRPILRKTSRGLSKTKEVTGDPRTKSIVSRLRSTKGSNDSSSILPILFKFTMFLHDKNDCKSVKNLFCKSLITFKNQLKVLKLFN